MERQSPFLSQVYQIWSAAQTATKMHCHGRGFDPIVPITNCCLAFFGLASCMCRLQPIRGPGVGAALRPKFRQNRQSYRTQHPEPADLIRLSLVQLLHRRRRVQLRMLKLCPAGKPSGSRVDGRLRSATSNVCIFSVYYFLIGQPALLSP